MAIVLPPFKIEYAIGLNYTPAALDYLQLEQQTNAYIDTRIRSALSSFSGDINKIITRILSDQRTTRLLLERILVSQEVVSIFYQTTVVFEPTATVVPSTNSMSSALANAFQAHSSSSYTQMLSSRLPKANLFTQTTKISFTSNVQLPAKTQPPQTSGANSATNQMAAEKSKLLTAALTFAVFLGCLILFLGVIFLARRCLRRQKLKVKTVEIHKNTKILRLPAELRGDDPLGHPSPPLRGGSGASHVSTPSPILGPLPGLETIDDGNVTIGEPEQEDEPYNFISTNSPVPKEETVTLRTAAEEHDSQINEAEDALTQGLTCSAEKSLQSDDYKCKGAL